MASADLPGPGAWQRAERHLRMIITMIVVLAGAAAVSMWSIEGPPEPQYPNRSDWSPLGYTYSLALFGFPLLALAGWFLGHRRKSPLHGKAFGLTLLAVFPLWCVIDLLLANRFFLFPNKNAHIDPMFWGFEAGKGWTRSIPYEEFAFYLGAVMVLVLLYLWASEVWYSRYNLPDGEYRRLARTTPPLVEVNWRTVWLGLASLATVILYKKLGPHPYHDGLPEYFMLLWALATIPTALLVRRLSPFMNDRALLFTIMASLLVSLLWEVTLALPNGWWNYRHEHMMGLFIVPWTHLPFEETLLWPISGWSNVLLFELFRVRLYSGRPFRELLFGAPSAKGSTARPV